MEHSDILLLNYNLLCGSIFVPFILGFVLLFGSKLPTSILNKIAFVGFALPCVISLWLACLFHEEMTDVHGFVYSYSLALCENGCIIGRIMEELLPFKFNFNFGLNGVSLPMYLLATIVSFAAGLHAIRKEHERHNIYLGLLLIIASGAIGTFASTSLLFFYLFHEIALIPTFIMMGIWGGRGKRTIAMETAIYLTAGAMLSLLGLILLSTNYSEFGIRTRFDIATILNSIQQSSFSNVMQHNIYGLLIFGFGILISLFPFHTWAPKAYATAPTPVSMIHAGVLKKFGLYGLIQFVVPILPHGMQFWANLLAILALANIIYIGYITIAQRDLRQMIGYSSVMHMGYCFLGIASVSILGFGGAVLLMFGHGLTVAMLFLLSDAIFDRTKTLEMNQIGGLSQHAPILTTFFILATFANVGLPGFVNFWGEISIFFATYLLNPWVVCCALLGVVISAIYGLRAIANIFMGSSSVEFKLITDRNFIPDLSFKECVPLVILSLTLFIYGFFPSVFTSPIEKTLERTIKSPHSFVSQLDKK